MAIATEANGWVSTPEVDAAAIKTAQRLLAAGRYCTLSTCANGFPWASPLLYVYDASWRLYWSSAVAAQHSQNLAANQGRAAIAIYSTDAAQSQVEGLYLSGTARELPPEQVPHVLSLLRQRLGDSPPRCAADYLPPACRRFYQFQPASVWITGQRLAIGSVRVDTKVQISLAALVCPPAAESAANLAVPRQQARSQKDYG
jgi:nitroimidazol reductase NimA-like FMN-containing flavoprotein (pyridoxamine 5'-phosphate oxidase superfamily)